MGRTNKLWLIMLFTVISLYLSSFTAFAEDYTFSWTANAEPVEGYKLYYKLGGGRLFLLIERMRPKVSPPSMKVR
jgi:hypothetical protein